MFFCCFDDYRKAFERVNCWQLFSKRLKDGVIFFIFIRALMSEIKLKMMMIMTYLVR